MSDPQKKISRIRAGNQKFLADVHLASLARQLRMLGLDTLWRSDFEDDQIVALSEAEQRIVITRDRELHDRLPEARRYLIVGNQIDEQLIPLIRAFQLTDWVRENPAFLSRCLDCNGQVLPVSLEQVMGRVPGEILTQHDEFFICLHCERVYWKGSHYDRMREWFQRLVSQLDA